MTAIHRFVPIESRRAVAAEGRGVPWVFDPPPGVDDRCRMRVAVRSGTGISRD